LNLGLGQQPGTDPSFASSWVLFHNDPKEHQHNTTAVFIS
jgi:hypothetical protein